MCHDRDTFWRLVAGRGKWGKEEGKEGVGVRHSQWCQCSECQLQRRVAQLRESIQRGMNLVASRQAQSIIEDFALDWATLYEGLNGSDELGIPLVQLQQRLHVT